MGTLFWVTGLSGAGKTTISIELYKMLKKKLNNVVFLDGDKMRIIFGIKGAYSLKERRELALSYARLCKFLTDQGINVVCATISMFNECRDWNRKHISKYREIYLRVSMEDLKNRDWKQMYSRHETGDVSQVMGLDFPFEEPKNPDMIIDNDGNQKPEVLAAGIYEQFLSGSDKELNLVG